MTDEPPEIAILDARLAEIDRRLSSIQTGLGQDITVQRQEPPPPADAVPPLPPGVEVPKSSPPPADAVAPLPPRAEVPESPPPSDAVAPLPSDAVAPLPPRAEVPEPPPPPAPAAGLVDELRALTDAHERLLHCTRELLAAYERVLARLRADEPAGAAVREFSVSAGPFATTEALRQFERTLAEIAEVREVSVRGFEGEDRAIVDVHLVEPNT